MADLKTKSEAGKLDEGSVVLDPGNLFFGQVLPLTTPRPVYIGTLLASQLIEVALLDLESVEKLPGYRVDMWSWHEVDYLPNGGCAVCLAGSVMARRLGADPHENLSPEDFDDDIEDSLEAINLLRLGNVHEALAEISLPVPAGMPDIVPIAPYEDDPVQFKSDMRALAEMLRANGL